MNATKYSERLARQQGERWEVEWAKDCPKDETGDCDIDAAKVVREHFHTREEAESRMRELEAQRLDFFGDPTMTNEHWELDWIDEDTGREFYHWNAGDHDVWRIDNGEIWQ
jgi:hypothetical protein